MGSPEDQREAARNRLLRRADFRFLLPNPSPDYSICFTRNVFTGRLRRAVELISGRLHPVGTRARGLPVDGALDLAVAVDPGPVVLRSAWTALRPGGTCYVEWYLPLVGGPAGVRRRLEVAGFEGVTCYWAWPWPALAPAQFWLPVEASGALHYFLYHRPAARGAVRRLNHLLRRTVWLLGLRIGVMSPICSVARKPALPANIALPPTRDNVATGSRMRGTSAMNADLEATIRTKWKTWALGPTPGKLSWFMLTGGYRTTNKITGLVFAEPESQPRLAVKMARVPESIAFLRREAAILRGVQALRAGGVPGVPSVLFSEEHAGVLTLGESAVSGLPVFTQLRPDTYRALALQATDWLVELAGKPEPCARALWWDRLVEPILADFKEAFGAIVDQGAVQETQNILATLDTLPLVCEHRDFGPWNVLIAASGGLGVLDWEGAELQGLPALDLIYFLSYLAFFLDGAIASDRYRESYRASLDPATLTGLVRRECLAQYAERVQLDPAVLDPLQIIVWLLHARSEYKRFVADAAGRPDPDTIRGSLFVSLWQEELQYVTRR